MNLHGQQKVVYDYVKSHPACTIREIRDRTYVMKPDMRISEINFAHRQETGRDGDVIVNVGRNKYREVLKSIAAPLMKRVQRKEDLPDGSARVWYEDVEV